MNKRALGDLYEKKSIEILRKNGYIILEKNYRIARAEIDIIAKKGKQIVFVEVKYRRTTNFGYGMEAVDKNKLEKIILAARNFLAENDFRDCDIRIDCMSFLNEELTWLKNITWSV